MKLKLLLCGVAVSAITATAQLAVPKALEAWKTTAGTQNFFYKNVTKTDAFGNVFVAGGTMSNGAPDILVAKYNSSGVQLWIKQFSGAGLNGIDFATNLFVTDTYVYLTGAITNNTTTPETDCFTMKLATSTGSVVWNTSYAGSAGNIDGGKFVTVDGTGNVYVTGTTYNSSGNADYLTLKYNGTTGSQLWVNTWGYTSGLDDGAIKAVLTGTIVTVTGAVTSTTNNYKVGTITMPQSTGVTTTSRVAFAATTTSVDAVVDMVTDGAGDIIIIGSQYVSGQGNNFYCQKLSGGTLLSMWTYTWNGASNLNDYGKAVAVDASNNVFIAGSSTSSTLGKELTLIKLNSSGLYQTSIQSGFSGNDEAVDMVVDASNNLYLTGYRDNATYHNKNYYTVKYNNSVSKIWEIETDGNSYDDNATNLALDSLNNIIVTGQSETSPGNLKFLTVKYVQADVTTPTDFNGETPVEPNWYYGNQGQLRNVNDSLMNEVKFYMDRTSPGVFIKNNSMSFIMAKVDTIRSSKDTIQRIDMTYQNRNEQVETYSTGSERFALTYFGGTGRDFTNVPANKKLITPNLYPNIDLMYSSNANGIKYYYIVKPGGDPRNILIKFTGITSYSINGTTNELSLNTFAGNLSFDRPTVYQLTSANATIAVTGWTADWQTTGTPNVFKFGNGVYTNSLTLVIEVDRNNNLLASSSKGNLIWNSFQGGNNDDYNLDLKLDKFGNIYTLADTYSSTYYVQNTTLFGSPVLLNQGTIAMRYNFKGERRTQVYISTPNVGATAVALTIVNDSNLVIVGSNAAQSLSGPVAGNPSGAYTNTVGPSFILKLNERMTAIEWRTFYPGIIQDVDAKNNGDIYLCAYTRTNTALQLFQGGATNIPGSSITNIYSEMVSKFNKTGVPLWSSYVGVFPAISYNGYSRIKVDTTNNQFYVFGKNNSGTQDWTGINTYGTFFHNSNTGITPDAYIKKFDSNDNMVVSTFVGGNGDDQLSDGVILANGDVCFVGNTTSSDTTNVIYNPYDGSYFSKKKDTQNKGWVLKFSPTFVFKWGTVYGDSAKTTAFRAVSTDNANNNLFIGGYTEGIRDVNPGSYYFNLNDSQGDAAFVAFSSGNIITWATSMGTMGIPENGVFGVQYNRFNKSLDFGGGSSANAGYPWQADGFAYYQNVNNGPGHTECTVGRFNVQYITAIHDITKDKYNLSDVSLYPNPANGSTNLYFKQGLKGNVNISICNMLGQNVESREYNSINEGTVLNFDITSLKDGLYFVTISNTDSKQTLKFVTFK